jgi:hypothetical protein
MDCAREAVNGVETFMTGVQGGDALEGRRPANVGLLGQGARGRDMCVMEAVSYIAGEPRSDEPACACPVIGAFLRSWNDDLFAPERNAILPALTGSLVGSRAPEMEERRGLLIGDWLIRTQAVAWLRLANAQKAADALERLPEIATVMVAGAVRAPVRAAARTALKVRNEAWVTPLDAATASERARLSRQEATAPWTAAIEASANAALTKSSLATSNAGLDAARAALWAVPGLRSYADLWNGAHDTARLAAHAAAGLRPDDVKPARIALQRSAVTLIARLIDGS